MERTRGMKTSAATMVKVMFLAAALVSTGCNGNSLMGPTSTTDTQVTQTALQGGQMAHPGGQVQRP